MWRCCVLFVDALLRLICVDKRHGSITTLTSFFLWSLLAVSWCVEEDQSWAQTQMGTWNCEWFFSQTNGHAKWVHGYCLQCAFTHPHPCFFPNCPFHHASKKECTKEAHIINNQQDTCCSFVPCHYHQGDWHKQSNRLWSWNMLSIALFFLLVLK